jgi:Fur family ferric uptake transcriptional regulator
VRIDNRLSLLVKSIRREKIEDMERNTQQRQAIIAVFENTKRPLAVQEVLELAQKQSPGLGVATVYRNIKALMAEERLHAVDLPGGVVLYELPRLTHHHHFSCIKCSKVYDIDVCGLNFQKLLPKGFQLREHEILLSGFCSGCSN